MSARTFYTHAQAALLLGVDDKTLNTWLGKAPPGITFQPSPADGRSKVISRTKLARLASLHGRTLPETDVILETDTRHAKTVVTLTLKVEEMEQQIQLLGTIFQQTVSELETQVTRLNQRISQLENTPASPLPPDKTKTRLPDQEARKKARIVEATIPPRGKPNAGNPSEHWCSVRAFCREHNTTRDWIEPRIADGVLDAERRPYGQHEQRVFTPAQQDAAVRWLDAHVPGTTHRCPHCPHSREE